MKKLSARQKSTLRLAAAAVAFLLLAGAFFLVLTHETGTPRERAVRAALDELIDAFEAKEPSRFLSGVANPIMFARNAEPLKTSHADLRSTLEWAFEVLNHIDIRPVGETITFSQDGNRAEVILRFHWSVSSQMYPNYRNRSEKYNPEGEPDIALLTFEKRNSDWILTRADLELKRTR